MEGQGDIKGVVIITLPPPDDPSQKKTFTGTLAFRENPDLGSSPSPEPSQVHGMEPSNDGDDYRVPLYMIPQPQQRRRRPFRILRSKGLASVFFATLVAYFIWKYGPSTLQLDQELDSDDPDELDRGMVYSIYSKMMIYPNSNASLPSVPAYPENPAKISPSAISKLVERDVVRGSTIIGSEAQAAPSADSKETTTTIFPLRGNVYPNGLYYVSARIGNPPREYYLDFDTGSDLTWLQCDAPCSSCAKGPHPLYKPSKANLVDCSETSCSSVQAGSKFGCSHGSGQCDYEILYADGGYSLGVLVRDRLAMILTNRSWSSTKVAFGCAYNQQGSLLKSPAPTDGMFGLSSSPVSLPSQLAQQGFIRNIFAHCIDGGSNGGGGYLFLGDKLLPSQGLMWAPLVGQPALTIYMLAINGVYLGDASVRISSKSYGTAIFDSGSSYTYLISTLYAAVVSAIQSSLVGSGLEHDTSDNTLPLCWRRRVPFRSFKEVEQIFKPLILEFKASSSWFSRTSKMRLTPEGYLIINSKGNICLGLLDASVMGKDGSSIIGDISMQGTLMVYDNENSRLGWMKMDCKKIPNAAVLSPSV